jgi:hypothetical protein
MKKLTKAGVFKYFSRYIRKRDSDWQGYCSCISCSIKKPMEEMHAGHFIHNTNACYFDERNVNAQCPFCNTFKHGNLHYYKRNLELKIGVEAVKELMDTKWKIHKFTQKELQKILTYCKENL